MVATNPTFTATAADSLSTNDPERVNELYVAVLDHLLTPPHVKEQLIESQSLEKKLQTVKMHNHLFESMNSWGDKEQMLLTSIQKMKLPDIPTLSRLKIILATGNYEMMNSFLDSGGVSILLKVIENRLMKKPITELDIAILFEILSCFKAIMKNSVGMEGVAQVQGSIDIIARCLRFDFKQFALQILEILSVCSFYSEEMALKVLAAMRGAARFNQEAPFAAITRGLIEQDIEVKAAILQFINALVMAISDSKLRFALRSELQVQLFNESLEQALAQVEKELALINADNEGSPRSPSPIRNPATGTTSTTIAGAVPLSTEKKLQRKSMVTMFGPRAYDERKVDAMIKNSHLLSATLSDTGSIMGSSIEIKSGSLSVNVNPLEGTMAGLLHAAKNTEKIESRFLEMVGGKKTKRRWYELDQEAFKWCAGHDKDNDYKGSVKVASIIDIRPYTTDIHVAAECQHCFEIETTDRTYALGCETPTEKDNWMTALQRCRDNSLMAKGSYKLQFRELSPPDVNKFAAMFQKQASSYQAIANEDRRHQLEIVGGLDLSNLEAVARYLQLESIAAGNTNVLTRILYELLLIPPGSDSLWEAVLAVLPLVRGRNLRDPDKAREMLRKDESIWELLEKKFKSNTTSSYSQVSKLALAVMSGETEIKRLSQQVEELQQSVSQLQEMLATTTTTSSGQRVTSKPRDQSQVNPILLARVRKRASVSLSSSSREDKTGTGTGADLKDKEKDSSSEAKEVITADKLPPPPLPSSESTTATAAVTVTVAVDPRFEKFEKMKKMLPEGAVRQKMGLEGFSEQEIEDFFAGKFSGGSIASPPPAAPPAAAAVDPRFEKYEKMKKMLPEGAVRQKMNLDGFSEAEIEAFFDGSYLKTTATAAPASTISPPAVVVDPRFEKYEKMRKMLPEGAVRQKMSLEGFSEAEIEAFFNPSTSTTSTSTTIATAAAVVSAPPDPRFEKFEKMKKMLPEGAVRQKMGLEGFSEQEIEDFFAGKFSGGSIASPPPAAPPAAAAVDPRFEKYEKMKKMLPEGAVRQKMTQDGFSSAEIDSFFGVGSSSVGSTPKATPAPPIKPKPVEEEPPEGMKAKPKIKPAVKLRGLFWSKLKSTEIKDTIWYQLPDFSLTSEEIQKLEESFANAPPPATGSGSTAATSPKASSSNQPKLLSVLDGKRTQNILILLGKLRKTPEEVLDMIIALDPKLLTQEVTNSLVENIPTPEEIAAIKNYSNPLVLDQASQLVYHMNRVPKLAIRLECHELGFSWEVNARTAANQLTVLLKGCEDFQTLKTSFQSLLAMILSIGNHINGDTARGQAYGVKLDVLMKFANLKAAIPSQGTLLSFLSQLVETHRPQLVEAFSELSPAILAAADLSYKQLQLDIALLETQHKKVLGELEKIKETKENPGLDSQLEDRNGKATHPLFQRLTAFKQKTSPILQEIKSNHQKTETSLQQILSYYNNESLTAAMKGGGGGGGSEGGDSEGGDVVKRFFGLILEFSRAFQAAVEENRQKRLLQEKLLQQQQATEQHEKQKSETGPSPAPAPMLKDLKKATSDIFGQFHKAQKTSNELLLEEFKNKLKKQMK